MHGFYLTIVRYKDHFLFVTTLTLSFFLLLNNQNPNMGVLRGKSIELVSFISSPVTFVKSLMSLEVKTEYLRKENLLLALKVESMLNLENENNELLRMLEFKKRSTLSMKPARVVNKGMQPNLLSIVINAGAQSSIRKNQPVLTSFGVIGKTVEVGENASIVQLITDTNYRLSVRILPSGATGILRFLKDGFGQIREVQKNVKVKIGDKVVTSGFSDIYPSGLPVGSVSGVLDDRGSFQKVVNIKLPSDITSFQNVFVIVEKIDEMD
ncbi:rod shape-determining protein MreC [Candidatus Marinimicrobia bacterium]|nr:rod shape-determining protein MreC [Candidatus Neomarinimicrobiota bacterium]MDC0383368.1 rod shape-determining protein MreC [Candidatus Neomarinimicrobiota bacterium]MDC0630650.1 rod shape-determining protein MreC [Candidatus Neomarinimicrobiota bacterium]